MSVEKRDSVLTKEKVILGSLIYVTILLFLVGIFGQLSAATAAGYFEYKQFLPQILVDYCVSFPVVQPNDITKDKEVEAGINNIRAENELPILAHASELTQAALRHSNDMAESGFVNHAGSDGSSVAQRLGEACYHWRAYGEIIAKGYETPEEVIAGWMDSPGHQGVILSDLFEEIGAGYAFNANGDDHYWTVDFGLRAARASLSAGNFYSCTYYLADEEGESWLSFYSFWPCDTETQKPTGLDK